VSDVFHSCGLRVAEVNRKATFSIKELGLFPLYLKLDHGLPEKDTACGQLSKGLKEVFSIDDGPSPQFE
jgi:hypothetical protein